MRRRLMGGAAGGGGEYIEGTATGSFNMKINYTGLFEPGTQYTITPDANGK